MVKHLPTKLEYLVHRTSNDNNRAHWPFDLGLVYVAIQRARVLSLKIFKLYLVKFQEELVLCTSMGGIRTSQNRPFLQIGRPDCHRQTNFPKLSYASIQDTLQCSLQVWIIFVHETHLSISLAVVPPSPDGGRHVFLPVKTRQDTSSHGNKDFYEFLRHTHGQSARTTNWQGHYQ